MIVMAAPSTVYTIALVAEMLNEDEEVLKKLSDQLDPEDGCLWVYDVGERHVIGLTDFGIESLKELLADQPHRKPSMT